MEERVKKLVSPAEENKLGSANTYCTEIQVIRVRRGSVCVCVLCVCALMSVVMCLHW